MITIRLSKYVLAAGCAVSAWMAAQPALAQDAAAGADDIQTVFDRNNLTIGLGAAWMPSYRGSDDYLVSAAPLVRGKFEGIDINPRAGGIALDFIPDAKGSKVGFSLGPVATLNLNRHNRIQDKVVKAAGKLDTAIEVGVTAGATVYRVLHAYDSLTLSADVKWDVNGAYSGMTWSPNLTYTTPLNTATLAVLSLGARHVDNDYGDYYYSVNAKQSAASGLPGYRAKGGWESVNATLLMGYDLSGDMRDGGWSVFGLVNYSRLLNDAKRTPYIALRGDANQWVLGAGVAYTF